MKKEIQYFCRYCNKKYHSFIEADLCMELDIKQKIKNYGKSDRKNNERKNSSGSR
jgi:hypothetical protein